MALTTHKMVFCSEEQYANAPRVEEEGGPKEGGGKHVIRYRIINNHAYHEKTPREVVETLEWAAKAEFHIRLDFGYTEWAWNTTHPDHLLGYSWGEDDFGSTQGHVGFSGDRIRVPLIVAPENAEEQTDGLGGPAISDDSLVAITKLNGEVLWSHPKWMPWEKRMETAWNALTARQRQNIIPSWADDAFDIERGSWAKLNRTQKKQIADYNRGGNPGQAEFAKGEMFASVTWAKTWAKRSRKVQQLTIRYDDGTEHFIEFGPEWSAVKFALRFSGSNNLVLPQMTGLAHEAIRLVDHTIRDQYQEMKP